MLAYNEATGEVGEYEVTAVWEHLDDVALLTIDGEVIETTEDHPFYTSEGEWVAAGELEIGDLILSEDGDYGEVESISATDAIQPMFNFTVDEAHTYFVGDSQWLVHNDCDFPELRYQVRTLRELGATPEETRSILSPRAANAITDPAVIGEINRTRTPTENRQARNYYKNNKEYARELWERRTGRDWPIDPNTGEPQWAEHSPQIKEGGHPLRVFPGVGSPNDPHNIPGPDGLSDHQRWGAVGTPAREARRH